MSTLAESKPKIRKAYVPTTALAKAVEFDNEMMHVSLIDGRIISVPIVWFPYYMKHLQNKEEIMQLVVGESVFTGKNWMKIYLLPS